MELSSLEKRLQESADMGLDVRDKPLKANKGRIKGKRIALKKDMTEAEKRCVLSEEIGHALLTSGDIINQKTVDDRKQEDRAHGFSIQMEMPIAGFILAAQHGCRNRYDISQYLDVPEDFIEEAVQFYKRKFGLYFQYDSNYVVYFEPLGVFYLADRDPDQRRD